MIKFENQFSPDNLSISHGTEEYTNTSRKGFCTELQGKRDMSRNARNNKNGKKENIMANLANMAKMTILPQSPTGQSTKQ